MNMRKKAPFEIPELIFWAADILAESQVVKPRLNAEMLLCHCTGRSRADLYARPEEALSDEEREDFGRAVDRRSSREPLQYIIGHKGFRYIELAVDARVLIPRPETEVLVERALELMKDFAGHPVVVDVGTGSGCVALSLARESPRAVVHATEISGPALQVARLNAERLGLDGTVLFHRVDMLKALPPYLKGECGFIVSNPPYVREADYADLPPEVREHEPRMSLVAGPRGTEFQRRLMEEAPGWLTPGGWLVMEGGEDQMEELADAAVSLGYRDVRMQPDLNGLPRIIEMAL